MDNANKFGYALFQLFPFWWKISRNKSNNENLIQLSVFLTKKDDAINCECALFSLLRNKKSDTNLIQKKMFKTSDKICN